MPGDEDRERERETEREGERERDRQTLNAKAWGEGGRRGRSQLSTPAGEMLRGRSVSTAPTGRHGNRHRTDSLGLNRLSYE